MQHESHIFNKLDQAIGWIIFLIALCTYWLSIEPTASYWDCGEYIAQADRLEIGHAPGNPIYIIAGRFFANFASSSEHVALMVNAMSGLLSAFTILFLFWSISHIVRKLLRPDKYDSKARLWLIFGAASVGALAYTWSDTFWFSAVEAEVYAFSSLCTALVFWLILKWEDNADKPHSDRFLILIAYLIGISVAIHLLNLLCIPAIALIIFYRKNNHITIWKVLTALFLSFCVIALILFGLIPGFVKVGQWIELICVNNFHLGFNSGAIIYSVLFFAISIWTIFEIQIAKSKSRIIISSILTITLSGLIFIGNNIIVWLILFFIASVSLITKAYFNRLPLRLLNNIFWSIFVIFIGYSSYAIILIRSDANPPMNENSPDNLFALSSYLNREQYSKNPLIYGATPYARQMKNEHSEIDEMTGKEIYSYSGIHRQKGEKRYSKGIAGATPIYRSQMATTADSAYNQNLVSRTDDFYFFKDYDYEITTTPELDMLFPRIFSSSPTHISSYASWAGMAPATMDSVEVSMAIDCEGNAVARYDNSTGKRVVERLPKPTIWQNLRFFFSYQVGYMYFRYFLWNFSGRQNDRHSQGQADTGNFITGIPIIDNAMLGDQSKLPPELGSENKGHNVYYILPLILGILGIIWLMRQRQLGCRYAFVIFLLFFMTGIAIVIYLNQTPNEPRERDYAFAGSFYAWTIWLGIAVPAIFDIVRSICKRICKRERTMAAIVVALSLAVPLQMLSQTYDDHDRSGRTAARDYAINILESLDKNAILFTNGDNFTFPLWYAQEVEGIRRDVRVVNLAYLSTDWYLMQMMIDAYDSKALPLTATPADIAMRRCSVVHFGNIDHMPADASLALQQIYNGKTDKPQISNPILKIPTHKESALSRCLISADEFPLLPDTIELSVYDMIPTNRRYLRQDELAVLDIVATNAINGWQRPIYWVKDVGLQGFYGLKPYFKRIGMVYQLTPLRRYTTPHDAEKVYELAMHKFKWGGADVAQGEKIPYFDETAGDIMARLRRCLIAAANDLISQADCDISKTNLYQKALLLLQLIEKSLPNHVWPYETFNEEYITSNEAVEMAKAYSALSHRMNNDSLQTHALNILRKEIINDAAFLRYQHTLPKSIKNYVSITTGLTTRGFYSLIDTYKKIGGDMSALEVLPQLANFNLEQIGNTWLRYSVRQTLIRDARHSTRLSKLSPQRYALQPADARLMDSTIYVRISDYINAGGTIDDLKTLAEFSDFDFIRSARLNAEYNQMRDK